jgi:hypothetical protein
VKPYLNRQTKDNLKQKFRPVGGSFEYFNGSEWIYLPQYMINQIHDFSVFQSTEEYQDWIKNTLKK